MYGNRKSVYSSASSGLRWSYFKRICQCVKIKIKIIIKTKSLIALLFCQLYFPFQYQGTYYPWSSYLRRAYTVYHIIIVVTGPKSTNGNPTWDIWQRHSEIRCPSHWLELSHTNTSPVWSISALTRRVITANPDGWPHRSLEQSPKDGQWQLINCRNHNLGI